MTNCSILLRDLRVLRGENWVAGGRAGPWRGIVLPKGGFACKLVSRQLKKNWWRLLALPTAFLATLESGGEFTYGSLQSNKTPWSA
jgi:hypothetical protein